MSFTSRTRREHGPLHLFAASAVKRAMCPVTYVSELGSSGAAYFICLAVRNFLSFLTSRAKMDVASASLGWLDGGWWWWRGGSRPIP